jgi:very-short-patch-repair endonuclease
LTWKERMHPRVSKAELEVFKGLSKRGLTIGMVTQRSIILKATIPDFLWAGKKKAVYLDGEQVHEEGDVWDEEVVFLLEKRGWQVLRLRYTAPLTKDKLSEILGEIQAFIGDA